MIINKISLDPDDLVCSKKRFFWLGILMFLIGVIALFLPLIMSFAMETLLGASILVAGVARIWSALGEKSWQQGLLALAAVVGGALLLAKPLLGMVTMGVMLGAFFLITGVAKCAEYFRVKDIGGSFWVFVSGDVDVLLAFVIWKNFFSAASAPGVILGVNMISTGAAMICLSRGCSRMAGVIRSSQRPSA